jgi:hypothetical protein
MLECHQSSQGKDGYERRFSTPRSTAVMHITTGITLNPSKDRKEAVGQNTKWNGKLSEPPPAPLREDIQKAGTRSEFNAAGVLRKEMRNKPSVQARCPEYQKLLKQKQVGPIGLAVAPRFVNLFAFHEQSKPCYSARLP